MSFPTHLDSVLDPIFAEYESLLRDCNALFAHIQKRYPECVKCKTGCSDCCHAVFDLSLVEALALNRHFERLPEAQRTPLMQAAEKVDRPLTKLKRDYYKSVRDAGAQEKATQEEAEKAAESAVANVLDQAAHARIPCPLLLPDDTCALYAFRPVTCRLYGVPCQIGENSHVCGKTGFVQGTAYPTVQMEKIQNRLDDLSLAIQENLHSRYDELHQVYVPVSMALLTNYDENYLGIAQPDQADQKAQEDSAE